MWYQKYVLALTQNFHWFVSFVKIKPECESISPLGLLIRHGLAPSFWVRALRSWSPSDPVTSLSLIQPVRASKGWELGLTCGGGGGWLPFEPPATLEALVWCLKSSTHFKESCLVWHTHRIRSIIGPGKKKPKKNYSHEHLEIYLHHRLQLTISTSSAAPQLVIRWP